MAGENVKKFMKIILLALGIFNLVWIIIGSIDFFNDDKCYDHFYSMWALMLSILIITYIVLGIATLAICCICGAACAAICSNR